MSEITRDAIPLDERLTAQEQDWAIQGGEAHGLPGHTGHRCYACAYDSEQTVEIHEDSGDYWQSKQIAWQEDCDVVMVEFDKAVATHFPDHLPPVAVTDARGQVTWDRQCLTCPVVPVMPDKPEPPFERRPAPE